ncbi:MAG: hypothetical protein H8M99_03900 [Gloeobacteraceae cyanobacterium ES-bin-144]|nr:hypothetical protein [Verrucomicrobiales bacterium]
MNTTRIAAPIIALAASFLTANAELTFGPIRAQPGESIRLVSQSETPGGTIKRTYGEITSKGTIEITRERELIWTFRDPAADGSRRGMVSVPKICTTSKIVLNGQAQNSVDNSPLNGKLFAMTRNPQGVWSFDLDGSLPLNRIRTEIEELEVYLKREWYPKRDVSLGDSWEFDPAWIKMVIEKDLSKAQTIGTMRLRQIRRSEKLSIAIIDVSVRSTGADFSADGSEAGASVELTGEMVVNLKTMLDESLDLKGTVTTSVKNPGESTRIKLPLHLVVSKSFVKDSPFP